MKTMQLCKLVSRLQLSTNRWSEIAAQLSITLGIACHS